MHLGPLHVVGMLATIGLIVGIGVYSGRKVASAADFSSGGGKAGAWIVCGAIMGTLVSGQATIGTAQLAFSFGMSAWWFTLGSGIGCLILAIGYAAPFRRSGGELLGHTPRAAARDTGAKRGAVAGGGRYDNMVGKFLGVQVPAVGFSIGFERVCGILLEQGYQIPGAKQKIALLYGKDTDFPAVLSKAAALREQYNVTVLPQGKKLGKQLGQLEAAGFAGAAFMDKDEVKIFAQQ